MFLSRQTGLGRDQNLITIRRRTRYGILLLVAGGILALILSLSILGERKGTLLVKANRPGAYIVLNGSVTDVPVGTPLKRLRSDIYDVSVSLSGYEPDPPNRVVKIEKGKTLEVNFSLLPIPPEPEIQKEKPTPAADESAKSKPEDFDRISSQPPDSKKPISPSIQQSSKARNNTKETKQSEEAGEILHGMLKVVTRPVEGGIFIDDIFAGRGKVTQTNLNLGEVVVRFGEVEGYRTPASQKAFLTQSWPYASLEGIYLPIIYISAHLDQSGRVITQRCELAQGYVLDQSAPAEDPVAGPGIKLLDEIGVFAWEIGYAFSNRNPPGQDYIEMIFDLPENWDGNKPLDLHLYGYPSDRKYPFALAGRAEIDVFVNERPVKKGYHPTIPVQGNTSLQSEVFPVNSFLRVGQNRIRVQASANSRCFYYLKQIVLL